MGRDLYYSDDYAGIGFANASFYYGYECSICIECGEMCKPGRESCDCDEDADAEWCFRANIGAEEIIITDTELEMEERGNVVDKLFAGICVVLNNYKLVKNELDRND